MLISRKEYLRALRQALERAPVVALLGPRQCGKTTLARLFERGWNGEVNYFDLESLPDQRRLQNPEMMLESLSGLVILDEIQLQPELFNVLRVIVDRGRGDLRFLLLGSASPRLVRGVSESLAGRVEFIELAGFDLGEVGDDESDRLWLRGGFPLSFLARNEADSRAWRSNFVRTFLERDIPQLGIRIPAAALRRFWTMLAHYHGQILNSFELARSLGLSDKTIRSYLDILEGTFMVRRLQPWHENLRKRQVKSPKIYLRDSGILHTLLEIPSRHVLLGHARLGASWEGFALEQALRLLRPENAYFWATHSGAELDLLFSREGRRYGLEFKLNEAPRVTRSMRSAQNDLELEHLWIVYPGRHTYPVDERISVLPLTALPGLFREP
jgi:predicted AAA+ superfamily ATPase